MFTYQRKPRKRKNKPVIKGQYVSNYDLKGRLTHLIYVVIENLND